MSEGKELDVVHHAGQGAHTGKLTPVDKRKLQRELAAAEVTRAALARKYGVTPSYVTKFAKQHARQIDDIRANLDDEFAGLWIANQEQRLAAYENEYDLASEGRNASHHEWIKARTAILKAVAEETGQIRGKQATVNVAVQHIIVGIDVDDLR